MIGHAAQMLWAMMAAAEGGYPPHIENALMDQNVTPRRLRRQRHVAPYDPAKALPHRIDRRLRKAHNFRKRQKMPQLTEAEIQEIIDEETAKMEKELECRKP